MAVSSSRWGFLGEGVGRVLVERSVVEQRFEAVVAVVRDGLPVVEVAAKFEVSRQSVHAWIRRYEAGGVTGLEDRSHQPFACPHQMPPAVEAELCGLRRQANRSHRHTRAATSTAWRCA